jgi:hypothetical protein
VRESGEWLQSSRTFDLHLEGALGGPIPSVSQVVYATLVVCALLSAGCRRCSELTDLHAEGGTAHQRSLVNETMQSMASWLHPDSICVTKVELANIRAGGRYNTVRRSVVIDDEVDDTLLPLYVAHELCHAVDLQWGILDQHPEAFSYGPGRAPERHTDRAVDREAVAEVCSLGEDGLSVLRQIECPDDPAGVWKSADVVLSEVYGVTPGSLDSVGLEYVARATPVVEWEPPARLIVDSHPDDNALVVMIVHAGGGTRFSVDADTGEQVATPTTPRVDVAMEQPPAIPRGLTSRSWASRPERPGEHLAWVSGSLPRGDIERLVVVSRDGVVPVEGCVGPGSAFAHGAEEALVVTLEGADVVWYRVADGAE